MNDYEIFEAMKLDKEQYLLTKDKSKIQRNATMLAKRHCDNNDNPFEQNTPGYDVFYDFIYFYNKWPKYRTTCEFKTMFLKRAIRLCDFDNPYQKEDSDE